MDFNQVYSNLNSAQKVAVDSIEGTVMVVAGPGTGKTQVLGARIANIINQTDTHAENILCLTFTEAATVALRNRLYDFIGTEAQRVNIYTYHAFCNMVIQENKHLFGYQDLDAASDLEILEVVKEIIDELPRNHELKRYRGELYYESKPLIDLFNLIKKDRLTPKLIREKCNDYLREIENSEDFRLKRNTKNAQKGDFNQKYYDEQERIKKLIAASELFNSYESKMQERKRYDYNDMINWVIDSFIKHPNMLLSYQEQFLYILVDEYQDTNGSQNELLTLLINYWDNPNVFVVGDDDQSIYKFQGANVQNIYEFYNRFKDYIKLIVLTENYRSTPSILNASNSVIQHNNERLVGRIPGLSKNIISSNQSVTKQDTAVVVKSYPNTYQEIVSIASEIKELNAKGVPLKEIAVLYRNHDQSEDLMAYLQTEEIPFSVSVTENILQEPIIIQLLQLLEYISEESVYLDKGESLLFQILHSNRFKFLNAFEIAKLSHYISQDYSKGWREKIHEILITEHTDILSKESLKELRQFWSDLEHWQKEQYNVSLQTLVEHIMAKGAFISRAIASKQSIFEVQCLKSFYSFLKNETAKKPQLQLIDFLQIIKTLQNNNLGINLNKVVYGSNGIQLMTVHGSKGLEFDYVYVLGCSSDKWERNGQKLPYALDRIVVGEPSSAHEEEGRRLFYVAMTRARIGLSVSYAVLDDKNKPKNKSVYVAEMEHSNSCNMISEEVHEEHLVSFFNKTIDSNHTVFKNVTKLDFVDHELERFRMSATNLNSYLKCPVSFFYQNIVRVPSAKSESMTFGTAVHGTLETLFNSFISDRQLPKSNEFVERYKSILNRHREAFTPESFKLKIEYGEELLPKYYDYYKSEWTQNSEIETEISFKNCEIDGVPIRGQIDKIIKYPDHLVVVDYKTGNFEYAKGKIKPPVPEDILKPDETDHNKIYGGDYWRQIMFYYILISQDIRYNKPVEVGVLDFIEPYKGGFEQVKIHITQADVATVRSQIKNAYTSIMNKEFQKGCNLPDCVWCNFNQYYLKFELFHPHDLLDNQQEDMDEL